MTATETLPAPQELATADVPELAVVLVTPGGFAEIRTTLRHLAAQTIADRIELLIVAVDPGRVVLPRDIADAFARVAFVAVTTLHSLARSKAVAIQHATAPIVAFAEDHSFPEPEWAAALVAAHAQGYAGVAPQMKCANDGSLLSRVAMFLWFAGAIKPERGFESAYPSASHNMSYRRDALLAFGDDLGRRMLAECFLHDGLRARGHRLWTEPAAVTCHVNMSRLVPAFGHAFHGGRLYGALRRNFGAWSAARRLLYAAASPLIPWLRLRRILHDVRRVGPALPVLPAGIAPMLMILMVHAAGEAVGYLLPMGSVEKRYSSMEVRRDRFVRPEERVLWS